MQKHEAVPPSNTLSNAPVETASVLPAPEKIAPPLMKPPVDDSPHALRELLEKNLKWSQIIYEQNRRINRKMLWTLIIGWIEVAVIVLPLIAAGLLLPTIWKTVSQEFPQLFGNPASGQMTTSSMEKLLDVLPVNGTQRDQLKSILK